MSFQDDLIRLEACKKAVDWVGNKTLDEAWQTCTEGGWMLWMLNRTPVALERETSQAMAFDFIKKVEQKNDIPEIDQILANAKKRFNKQDPNAKIKGSKELEKLIGKGAPDVALRAASQAIYCAAETMHHDYARDPHTGELYDDKKIVFFATAAAYQTYNALMQELFTSVPRKSQSLYTAKELEIKLDQSVIVRKHVPLAKIQQLWVNL